MTYGDIPHTDCNNEELYAEFEKGDRLPKSKQCLDFMSDLMSRCWQMRFSSHLLARELISGARTLAINNHFQRKFPSSISTSNDGEAMKLVPKLLASGLKEMTP